MRAGQLRHRIQVERPVNVAQTDGSRVVTWERIASVWARVSPLSGRELVAAQQINAEVSVSITIRAPSVSLQPDYRIVFDGRFYDVVSVLDQDERGIEKMVMCKQGVNDG